MAIVRKPVKLLSSTVARIYEACAIRANGTAQKDELKRSRALVPYKSLLREKLKYRTCELLDLA
jgi:hypothetical protein